MSSNRQVVIDAEEAIDKVFSDTSVFQSRTRKDLEYLRDQIYIKLESLPPEEELGNDDADEDDDED